VPNVPAKRALIVQHEHNGPAGLLGEHLDVRGYELQILQVMQAGSTVSDVEFPDPTAFDLIAPLGSIHGVYEDDVIGSWIGRELTMLRAAHAAGVPVFGICFGVQAAATAIGGSVEKAPSWEVGWYGYDTSLPDVIGTGSWFTWHGDRFLLPPDVPALATTPLCNQSFRSGRSAGVQFHPEVTREIVADWASKCSPAYFAAKGTSAEELLSGFDSVGADVAKRATVLFDWFLDEVAAS
jgi:GMP synthase-like glutamine amidotransferase